MASELSQLQPLNVLNLRDHIEQQIRNAILNGAFRHGERLVETALAQRLGVSRAPVREALAVLEREGIVLQIPRRGYFVVEFTDKDIEEIYSFRLLLEIAAVKRAMNRISENELAEMQRMVDELGEAALQQNEPEKIVALDLSFHELICRAADHSRLYSAWRSMRAQTQAMIGVTSRTHYSHPEQPKELHQRILDAIRDKDLEGAEETLTDHLLDAQRRASVALAKSRSSDVE
jgi:DNA-binding GntR family transcriptional regulator